MPTVPHFDFPLRLAPDGTLATVEQDTVGDYAAGVTLAFHTPAGTFSPLPDFGMPDLTFTEQPIGAGAVRDALLRSEGRAQLLVQEVPDAFDALLDRLTVTVSAGSEAG